VGVLLVPAALLVAGCQVTSETDSANGAEPAPSVATAPPWFNEITIEAGLEFVHEAGNTGRLHLPEIMGGGVGVLDYDGDGRLDLYLTDGGGLVLNDLPGVPNRLYRQLADGRFEDATAESGLGDTGEGQGVAMGDIDNDGHVDIFVANFGPDRLYRNRGDGTFEDATSGLPAALQGWSCSAAFFDYDNDGFLDLFVAQYVIYDPEKLCYDQAGRNEYCGPLAFPPARDFLLRNNGDGTFSDVSEPSGIATVSAAGLGVVADDFNDDGLADLYVANDAYANNLWLNQGDGTFRDVALMSGAAYNLHGDPEAGMGVVAADFDNNGASDLFVTNLSRETNTYYRSIGPAPAFNDATGQMLLGTTSMKTTGFGAAALDIELDGDLDLIVVNGRVTRADETHPDAAVPEFWAPYAESNLVYLNERGERFEAMKGPTEDLCKRVEVSRGLAVGDLDADGDLDLLVGSIDGPVRLYRNDAPRRGNWLLVDAADPQLGRTAIGARIVVRTGSGLHMRRITRAGSYGSSNDPRAHFGLAPGETVDRIEVRWPDGVTERFPAPELDQAIRLVRGAGEVAP